MKVVFFSWLSKSNINASIPLIKELIKKNIDIYYFGYEKYREDITKLNVNFIGYKDKLGLGNDSFVGEIIEDIKFDLNTIAGCTEEYLYFLKRTLSMYENYVGECLDIVREISPCLIIKDNSAQHGKIIGHRLNIKTIGFNPMMSLDKNCVSENIVDRFFYNDMEKVSKFSKEQLVELYNCIDQRYKQFCSENNYPYMTPIEPYNGDDILTLSYAGEPLNYKLRDKKIKFIKPPLNVMDKKIECTDDIRKFLSDSKPLILVSSGALINTDSNYYSNFIRALWDKECNVIISIPGLSDYNKNIPENFLIKEFVPQQTILRRADLLITFGGYNSICEAIEYKVPMLVFPQMNDQFINARRIEELEIGLDMSNKELNLENLTINIFQVLNNIKYKNNIKYIKREMNKLDAIDKIMEKEVFCLLSK